MGTFIRTALYQLYSFWLRCHSERQRGICGIGVNYGSGARPLPLKRISIATALLILAALPAFGQDPFEIQVYEYKTVPKGMWNLETHLNYIGRGTKVFEGTMAPTHNQIHMTYELTRGLTDHFELAGYLVTARRPGGGLDFAAWRVRPRFRLPESWAPPVNFSLSTEVALPRKTYDENSATLEIRPIIEKSFGRFQLDLNPVVGRALRGPGTAEGWDFEPGARLAYAVHPRFKPSFEYYGSTGPVFDPLPGGEQVHQFFPGADILLGENVIWNLGLGLAATSSGNHLVYKMRIGILFGGTNR